MRASESASRTEPCWRVGDWLDTFTVNSSTSPSRRKRGGFGCTMISFAVIALSSINPARRSRSCAKPMNFQVVSASGMVNSIATEPSSRAIRCGKKNAVSFRFFRAETLARSGAGGAGGTAPPPGLSADCISILPSPSAFEARSFAGASPFAAFLSIGAPSSAIGAIGALAAGIGIPPGSAISRFRLNCI